MQRPCVPHRSCVCNDLGAGALPCQAQAVLRGYRSACAVPLRLPKDTGTLAIYSSESSFFDDEEIRLLEDVASDVSFAAEAINAEQQRQRAEQVLRETHRQLETIFEASPVAIVAMDPEGIVTAWNRAAEQVFGWAAKEVVGLRNPLFPEQIDAEHMDSEYQEILHRILLGTVYSGLERRRKRKDGSWVDVSLSAAPLRDAEGSVIGLISIYVDVSERKRLESQLWQAQKLETVGRLAGGVAHDFNNLLTVVNGHADLLLQHLPPNDPLASNAGEIRKAGQQAANLTRQLLAFSRMQVFQPRVVSVNKTAADMEDMLRRLIGEGVQLTIVLDSDAACVSADPVQLQQVIMNLVVNARDAIGSGGKITVRTGKVAIEPDSQETLHLSPGEYVTLTVADNGIGIDEATQSHIFEPFFTTKGKGTGLGLSTVWGIVEQSKGHIHLSSELNRGTTFTVYLPQVEGGVPCEERPESKVNAHGTETLLLVEDRDEVRGLTTEILKSCGYRVLEAKSGVEALSICRGYADTIGLVITDVMMPGMTGPELGAQIKSLHPQMKILYMSGYASENVLDDKTLAHSAGFLEKPFSATKLAATVRQILGARAQHAA